MADVTFSTLLLLLLSPAVGSFLNVLIDRLPRREDVLCAPSACRGCGRRLRALDLLPILSFVLLRGRCRGCGSAIAPWHFYVELTAPGLALLAVLAGGSGPGVWLTALILWLLLALLVCDLLWFRLPDALTLSLLLLALLRAFVMSQGQAGHDLARAALGAALGLGLFWGLRWGYGRLRRREGLGLGDVKLMAGIGALVGPWALPELVLTGSLLALAMILTWSGRNTVDQPALSPSTRLPFGAALCLAAMLVWLWQQSVI